MSSKALNVTKHCVLGGCSGCRGVGPRRISCGWRRRGERPVGKRAQALVVWIVVASDIPERLSSKDVNVLQGPKCDRNRAYWADVRCVRGSLRARRISCADGARRGRHAHWCRRAPGQPGAPLVVRLMYAPVRIVSRKVAPRVSSRLFREPVAARRRLRATAATAGPAAARSRSSRSRSGSRAPVRRSCADCSTRPRAASSRASPAAGRAAPPSRRRDDAHAGRHRRRRPRGARAVAGCWSGPGSSRSCSRLATATTWSDACAPACSNRTPSSCCASWGWGSGSIARAWSTTGSSCAAKGARTASRSPT